MDFDCEYHWKRSSYRQSETKLIDDNTYCIRRKIKSVNFGPITTKFACLTPTHHKSILRMLCRVVRLRSDNMTLPAAKF